MAETPAPVAYAQPSEPLASPISGETVSVYGYSARPDGETGGRAALSNVQPVWQYVLLQFCSFGLYDLFWFYSTWSLLKRRHKLYISPAARSLFREFFAIHLSREVYKLAKEAGLQPSWSPVAVGCGLVCFNLLASLCMRSKEPAVILIGLAFFAASISVRLLLVHALNGYWRCRQPGRRERDTLSRGAWVVVTVGGLIWLVRLLGILVAMAAG